MPERTIPNHRRRRTFIATTLLLSVILALTGCVQAPINSTCGTSGGGNGGGSEGGDGGKSKYTLKQVTTFASEPVTSTWDIPEGAAEQWFLKQSGAQATVGKYGLTSSNIGAITSAVKTAKVSPVFFYLYTVNEGGGAGGFINHYAGDIAGGGPANARRDAQYLASQSRQTGGTPATGGGEPADLPTKEAQQILSALPAGSIGVVYIQATSAVTAELEDLSGKTGAWTGAFNRPLSASMGNISTMGGDPAKGGTSISANCDSGAIAGAGMTKGINWAKKIAANDGYGYDQPGRASGWEKWKSDPGCTSRCGSFDCSSLISAIILVGGYVTTNPNFATGNEGSVLEGANFKKVASSATTSKDLQPGDILVSDEHTEMYIGNNQNVGAHINENNGTSGGQVGDQTGGEISVGPFYDGHWNAVYRASS